MQKPIEISIDTKSQSSTCLYDNIRKGDTLLMDISIYQNSASLDLTGQSMHIVLQKPDGYAVEKIINSVTGNNFKIAFDVQAAIAVGDVEGIIEISDSNGTNITNTFTFEVKENLACSVVEQSKNEIETLSQIVSLINSYNANADNLAKQNDLAVQHEAELTEINNSSSDLDKALKDDIAIGQPLDVALKADISNGKELDVILKDDIAKGESTDNNLIIHISDGNNVIAQLNNVNWNYIQSMFSIIEKLAIGTLDDENGDFLIDENNEQFIG